MRTDCFCLTGDSNCLLVAEFSLAQVGIMDSTYMEVVRND